LLYLSICNLWFLGMFEYEIKDRLFPRVSGGDRKQGILDI
jgi:hypothetical protein